VEHPKTLTCHLYILTTKYMCIRSGLWSTRRTAQDFKIYT